MSPGSTPRSAATGIITAHPVRFGSNRNWHAACSVTWRPPRRLSHPAQDAEPSKILHETRNGEMATLGEMPFGRYYGSVDATPFFVLLAGAYYERTADRPFAEAIWPHVEAALAWIDRDRDGDRDGDGFVEYERAAGTA